MVAQYNYLTTSLVSNTVLGELPVNNTSLDCQLNQAGNMSAGGKLSDSRITDDDWEARTEPGKTAFWAYRENQIVWGGIILSREYQSEGKSLTITGQTFECYASKRFPRSVIGTTSVSWNQGQCATIDALWSHLQGVHGGSIGVIPAVLPNVDPVTKLVINGYDLSTSYLDLINSVAQLQGGPDWTIAWTEDGYGLPLKQLVVNAPIGNPVGATDLVIDYPGAITSYIYTENASSGANSWWSVGDGEGATTVVGNATDSSYQGNGYPLWEGVNDYSGVTVQSTINNHASSDLRTFPIPYVTHAGTFKGDGIPPFGSYGMGDYVQANVKDPRFSSGRTFNVRIIGWTIQPPDEGNGTEQINPVFDAPSVGY